MKREEIAHLRDSDPSLMLTNHFSASLAPGSAEAHATRMFLLPAGVKVGVTPARFGGFVWVVNGTGQAGRGCINLVMELAGCDAQQAVSILAGSTQTVAPKTAAAGLLYVATTSPVSLPAAAAARWPAVSQWLVDVRGLPVKLVDEVHRMGKVHADQRGNAVFPRVDGGAFVRGTGSIKFQRTIGGKSCGPYVLGGTGQVVIVESAIDALSIKSMAPHVHVLATGGGLLTALDLVEFLPNPVRPIILSFDSDSAGQEYTRLAKLVWPDAKVRVPDGVKDWNDLVKKEPNRIHASWL